MQLFQRTTRRLSPTEQGKAFYPGACDILDAVDSAEAKLAKLTDTPTGTIIAAAPLGLGRRLIGPAVPEFLHAYPNVKVRLRLTDRAVDLTEEGLDLAFFLGLPKDSTLRRRKIADIKRVLCAAPAYIAARGMPRSGEDLVRDRHECLNLRFPGAAEYQWRLQTPEGHRRFRIAGRLEADNSELLTDWALAGHGVALKPVFEVADHLQTGRLVPVAMATPPEPVQLACLFTHQKWQDPKTRLFMDFMAARLFQAIQAKSQVT